MSTEPQTGPSPTSALADTPVKAATRVIRYAQAGLTDRESLVETLMLCAVAGEHALIVGPPGTAKSEAVRRVSKALGGGYFEYLLGRFTEPNEVFGPVNLHRLREGVVEVETTGMLPEAEIAFLDEVFLGSTAILNTLLGILNERVFRRGATVVSCPLRLCVGATNALPEDVALAAFADRFLVRMFVEPVSDPRIEDLLEAGWQLNDEPEPEPIGIATLDELVALRKACDVDGVRPVVGAAIRRMRAAGILLSDRRAVRSQSLIAAAAVLAGRSTATAADLWTLPLVAPTAESQLVAREALGDLLESSSHPLLPRAAEEASAGPIARANRLTDQAHETLAAIGAEPSRDDKLRIEALLREIDAGFGTDTIPADLHDFRAQLIALVQA